MPKLTQRGVETTAPDPARRKILSDSLAPGLQLRIAPSGAKTWCWWGRVREPDGPGRPRRVTIGPLSPELSLAAARERARELRALARAGVDPAVEQRRAIEAERQREREELAEAAAVETLGDLVRDWLGWGASRYRPETLKGWHRLARVELAPLAGRPAQAVTRRDVRELLEAIGQRSGWLSNRTLEVVRRAYSWAIEQDRIETSPVVGIRKLYDEEKSERVLSRDELRAILAALDPKPLSDPSDEKGERKLAAVDHDHADVVRLLLLTGVRRGAVIGMLRSEVEGLEDGNSPTARWTIPGGLHGRAKNRKAHAVPLVPQAVALIRPRLGSASGYLFPSPLSKVSPVMTWQSREVRQLKTRTDAVLGSEAPRWRIHDIRHTVATLLREELRVSREVVSLILGHVEGPAATRVYDRSELLDERRAALVAWADWLDKVRTERKRAQVAPLRRRRDG